MFTLLVILKNLSIRMKFYFFQFALNEIVHIKDALKFVKSYGLTEYSCTKLLKILDDYSELLDGDLINAASEAIPFIVSYKKKGFAGGDKVYFPTWQ